MRKTLVAVGAVLLVVATVLAFLALDQDSYSASDTLRPFLLSMVPVWGVAVVAAAVLLRDGWL